MVIIAATIILLSTIYFKVVYDFKLWKKHIPINHAKEILIVSIPVGVSVYLFGYESDCSFPLNYLISFLLCASWYMFLFNGGFNLVRHFNWWFIGTPDPNDSGTEKFFRKIGMPATIALQILLVICSTYLYFAL